MIVFWWSNFEKKLSFAMWQAIAARLTSRYIKYLTLPIGIVVGTIGYNLEQRLLQPKTIAYLDHSIADEREERLRRELAVNEMKSPSIMEEKSRIGPNGPNKQKKPVVKELEPVYESEDELTLDFVPESVNSVQESDDEEEVKRINKQPKEIYKVNVKQVDPFMVKHFYNVEVDPKGTVVSENVSASDIDYVIELEPYQSKAMKEEASRSSSRRQRQQSASSTSSQEYRNNNNRGPSQFPFRRYNNRYRPVQSYQNSRPGSSASSCSYKSKDYSTPHKGRSLTSSNADYEPYFSGGSESKTPTPSKDYNSMVSLTKRFGVELRFEDQKDVDDFDDNASLHSSVFDAPIMTFKNFSK
ncbi:hypothetical protein M3Y98_00025800 [Aphelenchoides besseyi]|nr:hypothetical protein M3Y98_00025800 [Aphelenchoides besseyi]KAI6199300.1 hypothetical protein M3Y96_00612300 [Aphelenchoides besseyi]